MSSHSWFHEEQQEDQEQQEEWSGSGPFIPARGVNDEFCQMIQSIKWKLYSSIILSPPLQTDVAQDNDLIKVYLSQLNQLYFFLERAASNQIREMMLSVFVINLRREILGCAKHIVDYGKANHFQAVDWIPYKDYLNITLRVHPFVHHKRMIGGQEDNVEDM